MNQYFVVATATPKVNSTIKLIRKKLKENHICISKADEGNSSKLMNWSDYNFKIDVLLATSGAVSLWKFEFDKFNASVRSSLVSGLRWPRLISSSLFWPPLVSSDLRWPPLAQ